MTVRRAAAVAAAPAVVVVAVAAGLCLGSPVVPPGQAWAALADPDGMTYLRIWEIRAPRTIIGACCGAAFGIAGLLLQRALANPLAVPELLGVSSGAACAVAAFVVTGSSLAAGWYPFLALVGAMAGGGITLAASRGAQGAVQTLLVGAAVSSALAALTIAIASMAERLQLQTLLRYLSGSLLELHWADARVIVPWVLTAVAGAVVVSPRARALALGDDAASAIGVDPRTARLVVLVVAAALVAVPTAFVGAIAWVGFAAPHLVRWRIPDLRPVGEALATGAVGAVVVIGADIASRTAFAPFETPLGAWTAAAALVVAGVMWMSRTVPQRRAVVRS